MVIDNEINYLTDVLKGFADDQKEWWIYKELRLRLAVLKAIKREEA